MRYRFCLPAWVLTAALLVACQPLPRPFAPLATAPANPLLSVKDGVGVAVLDLSGAPDPTSRAVTSALIGALLERNIPAALFAGGRESIFVYGQAKAAPLPDGRLEVYTDWHLVDPRARPLGRHRTRATPTAKAWRTGAQTLVKTLAASAAEGIAELIRREDTARAVPNPALRRRAVFLSPIVVPPSLDGSVMQRAMGKALPTGGIRFTERRSRLDLVLDATITIGPAIGGWRRLSLVWQLSEPGGRTIGRLDQANDVEIVVLETSWPALADLIAQALVPELRALIARAGQGRPDTVYRVPAH